MNTARTAHQTSFPAVNQTTNIATLHTMPAISPGDGSSADQIGRMKISTSTGPRVRPLGVMSSRSGTFLEFSGSLHCNF